MRRPSILLVAGAILGVVGGALVLAYVRDVESQASAADETVSVYVARQVIPAGTSGAGVGGDTEAVEMPRRYAPDDALTDLETVGDRVALSRLDEGEVLRQRDFGTSATTKGELAIPAGKEAMAVAVNLDGGVARYPQPGDRVNVFATFRDAGQGSTVRILSDVEVLATQASGSGGKVLGAGDGGQTVYLLAVSPDQAGRLVFGKTLGSIWLSLVPEGQQSPPVGEVTLDVPLSDPGQAAPAGTTDGTTDATARPGQ